MENKNKNLKDEYQRELNSLIGTKGRNKRIGILRKAIAVLQEQEKCKRCGTAIDKEVCEVDYCLICKAEGFKSIRED